MKFKLLTEEITRILDFSNLSEWYNNIEKMIGKNFT